MDDAADMAESGIAPGARSVQTVPMKTARHFLGASLGVTLAAIA
jgi:hypothetical protein